MIFITNACRKGETDMKMKIYNFLVNRHSGIREKYHRLHDNADSRGRILSYGALLGMNARYYLLRDKKLDMPESSSVYEERNLLCKKSESVYNSKQYPSAEAYIKKASGYDVISFDIFDTLIFRPFSSPTDVFFFVGEKLGIPDFKRIRMEQEHLARMDEYKKSRSYEITLDDIWTRMERETGVSKVKGIRAELDAELEFCYANPFMKDIYKKILEMDKEIILTSDMYLPSDFIEKMMKRSGYDGFSHIYMSCETGKSKAKGDIYVSLKKKYEGKRLLHIGDNAFSDVQKAQENGTDVLPYHNVNADGESFRSRDMSPVVGSAYRGLVNARLRSGFKKYAEEYEYGYVYGGLFVLGYCSFIHDHCKKNQIEKILFLSRDGDILKKVYDELYPGSKTEYVYLSRSVSTKLMAEYNKYDFFRRFIMHKVNQNISIRDIFKSMGLSEFLTWILDKKKEAQEDISFRPDDVLTDKNADMVKKIINSNYKKMLTYYSELSAAAEAYYSDILSGCEKVAAIDIGWAGSGALSLSYLAENVWNTDCAVTGIVAGTNTIHNAEPEASEIFLQSGKLVSYVFSQSHNRDVMKKHDPNKNYNVYWELLLSSPARQFSGFGFPDEEEICIYEKLRMKGKNDRLFKDKDTGRVFRIVPSGDRLIKLYFGKTDAYIKGIMRIRKGIMDFVNDYRIHFGKKQYMFNISGRDAAAPMLIAASHNERYLKDIAAGFDFVIDVG